MARPKRTTEEEWYDIFATWDVDDQAVALKVLEQVHRMSKRAPLAGAVRKVPSEVRAVDLHSIGCLCSECELASQIAVSRDIDRNIDRQVNGPVGRPK